MAESRKKNFLWIYQEKRKKNWGRKWDRPTLIFYFILWSWNIRNNILTLFCSRTNNRVFFPLIMRAWHINKWVLDQFGISIEVRNYKKERFLMKRMKKKILSISVLGQFLFILWCVLWIDRQCMKTGGFQWIILSTVLKVKGYSKNLIHIFPF